MMGMICREMICHDDTQRRDVDICYNISLYKYLLRALSVESLPFGDEGPTTERRAKAFENARVMLFTRARLIPGRQLHFSAEAFSAIARRHARFCRLGHDAASAKPAYIVMPIFFYILHHFFFTDAIGTSLVHY